MNKKIKELQKQIDEEHRKMDVCPHVWGPAFSNPGTRKVPYGIKTVAQGSDIWPEAEGYRDETFPRWSRECQNCGKVEHTEKQEPVIKSYKPIF